MEKWDYISSSELQARISMAALEAINFGLVTGGDPAEKLSYIEGIRRMTLTIFSHIQMDGKEQKQDDAG